MMHVHSTRILLDLRLPIAYVAGTAHTHTSRLTKRGWFVVLDPLA